MAFTEDFYCDTKWIKCTSALCPDNSDVGLRAFSEQAWSWSSSGLGIKMYNVFRTIFVQTGMKCFQWQNQIYEGKRGELLKTNKKTIKQPSKKGPPGKALAHCCQPFAYLQAKDEECNFSKILQTFHFMTVYDLLQGCAL